MSDHTTLIKNTMISSNNGKYVVAEGIHIPLIINKGVNNKIRIYGKVDVFVNEGIASSLIVCSGGECRSAIIRGLGNRVWGKKLIKNLEIDDNSCVVYEY